MNIFDIRLKEEFWVLMGDWILGASQNTKESIRAPLSHTKTTQNQSFSRPIQLIKKLKVYYWLNNN